MLQRPQEIMYVLQEIMYVLQEIMYVLQEIMYVLQEIMYVLQETKENKLCLSCNYNLSTITLAYIFIDTIEH